MKIFRKKAGGFTLIELLVAITILTTIVASVNLSLTTHLKANHFAKIREEGAKAAQSVIDELRFEKVSDLPSSGTEAPWSVTIDPSRVYLVYVTYCDKAEFCTSDDIRYVSLEVKLQDEVVYKTNTVFTALDGSGNTGAKPNTTGPGSCWGC